jgi:hypothetical protein
MVFFLIVAGGILPFITPAIIGYLHENVLFKKYQTTRKANRLIFQINSFKNFNHKYPEKLEVITHNTPYSELAKDSWGTPFNYTIKDDYVLITSAGKDRIFDTPDDILLNSKDSTND